MKKNLFTKEDKLCKLFGRFPLITPIIKNFYNGYMVLTYHSVSNLDLNYNKNIKLDYFVNNLNYFSDKFEFISLNKILSNITSEKSVNGIKVAITFDDGYLNNFREAVPILKQYNIPATFFINIDFIEKGYGDKKFMNWDQITEISKD
jgi:peptidoglycan/xylan/chitin deacetylase (PgdA/CDA1 family)